MVSETYQCRKCKCFVARGTERCPNCGSRKIKRIVISDQFTIDRQTERLARKRLFGGLFRRQRDKFQEAKRKSPPTKSTIKYLLIFADRNADGSGAEWGPRTDLMVRKVLGLIDAGSVKGENMAVFSHPDIRPDDPIELLTMRIMTQGPLLNLPMNPQKVKFYPYRFEEASGVAAVQFK